MTLEETLAATTAADHKAIYQSSARDYAGWLARQEPPDLGPSND